MQVNNLPLGADLAQNKRPSRADRVRTEVKRGNRRPVELLNRQTLWLDQRARRRRSRLHQVLERTCDLGSAPNAT